MPSTSTPIPETYFGMTVECYNYDFGYYSGPVETWPTIPFSIARSHDVWSAGDGTIHAMTWADLNPAPGVFDFTHLDAWINACTSHGVQMVYTLSNPPAWAGGMTPDPAALQAFVQAIVTHAAGKIQYWEGFNEYDAFLNVTPAQIVALQQALYQTAKSIDPTCVVLSPTDTAPNEYYFFQFLQAGGGSYFDIAAMHGYVDQTGESVITRTENFKAALAAFGLSDKPIWDTEWGWWPQSLPDQDAQAAFISKYLVLQWALGIEREFFYAYDNANAGIYNFSTGALTEAGMALRETTQWLLGASEPNGYTLNGTVYTVGLTENGQNSLVVWNSAGPSSFSAGPYTQYVDLQGQMHAITGGVVNIGNVPILLQTPVLDTQAPVPTFTKIVQNSDGTLTLTGTSEPASQVAIYDKNGTVSLGTVMAAADGTWSFKTGTLSQKIAHTFTATGTDQAGNKGASSGVLVYGTNKAETLSGGSGNDLLVGGGGSDTFVFSGQFGHDIITDFQINGRQHDVIQFDQSAIAGLADVLAHAAQVGNNVVIAVDAANSVTLTNVQLSSLKSLDFHFV